MYENHDLVKNGLKMVKMANRSLHQSSFRLDMRYRKFEAFLETSSFFPVVWRGITLEGGEVGEEEKKDNNNGKSAFKRRCQSTA